MGQKDKEYDIFRESKLRYLGYANEVGESFRSVVPGSVVRASYYVAFGYVIADTIDKSCKVMQKDGRITKVMSAAGDALIWQTLASIIIPGITINRICTFTCYLLSKRPSIPPSARCWITVGAGLASIPLIVSPIDTAVTVFMNNTYRRIF